jgi:myo-inositol 2-dehydrogenase/D-chiro-inositol 1-dehydrogenase
MNGETKPDVHRRAFLGAAGLLLLKPQTVRGFQANSAVRVGLLGCGGRGATDATSIAASGPARVVALADLFEDRLTAAKDHFADVAPGQMFHGPHAAEQILASREVDAVVIATPPYFHAEHLAMAVAAGKHVYCEKPVGVDVPGALRAIETGKKAEGRVSLDVGFQIRKAPPFVELVRRIHAGALGEICCAEAHYFCPFLALPAYPNASPQEFRLRHWLHDRVLSGDIIVEQNIHVIDICNWMLQSHPLRAIGTGGRKGRSEPGDCWSHFDVVFDYPNSIQLSFSSTQFGKGAFDVNERVFGTRGNSSSPYSGPVQIAGDEPWTWAGSEKPQSGEFSLTGKFSDNLAQADVEKHADFVESIVTGKFHNQAALGAESALSAMLGRTAAYTGNAVAWDELLRSTEVWEAGIDIARL